MCLLLLDNHDSFTWNLAELLRSTGKVNFNIISSGKFELSSMQEYDSIIFSPGPGLPQEQPTMFRILKEIEARRHKKEKIPSVLGVCLGMQAIALHFGAKLFNLPEVVHGQPRKLTILRPDHFLFKGIPNDFKAGLYHSWAVDPESLPKALEVLAETSDGTLMALTHKTLPVCGVQFHPESIMTEHGKRLVENFLSIFAKNFLLEEN